MRLRLVYADESIVVAIKPSGVLSTDELGGMPELVRNALGSPDLDIRTVHRLDRVVSGLMVLARGPVAASELSRQIRENLFEKEYLAVVHGTPEYDIGRFWDLLWRDKARKMTFVASAPEKGVQEAILHYQTLNRTDDLSRVRIQLETGRTHQIRAQFSGRGWPLVGDRKYSLLEDECEIALWSYRLAFTHPKTGEKLEFTLEPPQVYPWTVC